MEPFGDSDKNDLKAVQEKGKTKRHEYLRSIDSDLVYSEDMIPGDPWRFWFNRDRAEWMFEVIGTVGMPRKIIGTLVIVLKDNGAIMVFIE